MNVPWWSIALLLASWLAWGALCWMQGYREGSPRPRSPRTKSDE